MKHSLADGHIHQLFENISPRYDLANNLISFFQHKKWRKHAMQLLQAEKGAKALDLCCGTGGWTILLARAVGPKGAVYGLDFSEKMLLLAGQKAGDNSLHNITLCKGDVTSPLPFADNYFDYVTIGFGLRNLGDYQGVMQEARRVLKSGGRLACLETSKPSLPLFKEMYLLYLRFFVPLLGMLLQGCYREYLWLYKSTLAFPHKAKLADDLRDAGFSAVQFCGYWGGTVAVHLATKCN